MEKCQFGLADTTSLFIIRQCFGLEISQLKVKKAPQKMDIFCEGSLRFKLS